MDICERRGEARETDRETETGKCVCVSERKRETQREETGKERKRDREQFNQFSLIDNLQCQGQVLTSSRRSQNNALDSYCRGDLMTVFIVPQVSIALCLVS